MDYYQGVVVDYLRADRAVFVNTECCIQLKAGKVAAKNEHWYCDAIAIDLRGTQPDGKPVVFLCEVTYAVGVGRLIHRLKMWNDNWAGIRAALVRDCRVDPEWEVRPWLFVPNDLVKPLLQKMKQQVTGPEESCAFKARITTLESVQPWKLKIPHSDGMTDKSETAIPQEMWS